MATSLSEVNDLFMQTVRDYRLITLFDTSPVDFENYLEAWLKFSIVEFDDICDQSLDYDETTKEFSVDLSLKNKVLLATLMMKYWMQKNVNDITQMNLHVTDRDYKVASEAQNLREKVAYLDRMKESCSDALIRYGYSTMDWTDWLNQQFEGV